MRYEKPKMELLMRKENVLTVSLEPGDVTEGGGLPEIDMSGED